MCGMNSGPLGTLSRTLSDGYLQKLGSQTRKKSNGGSVSE